MAAKKDGVYTGKGDGKSACGTCGLVVETEHDIVLESDGTPHHLWSEECGE